MKNGNIHEAANDAWLRERAARDKLETAIEAHASSRGLGRLLSKITILRAEQSVDDTAEHLDLLEEVERYDS
ncbi:MAG TPA: hypothetical protein VMR76_02045 [Candidatus Saccharimonadia bacterium]|jgi:hypothetical protein|nr:hypothetical protein [Candidatus Saccharimonadia bacterium]